MKLRWFAFGFLLVSSLPAADLIARHPQRAFIVRALQRLVDDRGPDGENHFYLVRTKNGIDWVYWWEGHEFWSTDLHPYYEKKGRTELRARAIWALRLSVPRKSINLDTDLVAEESDIRGSTFLVTRSFAAEVVRECLVDGEQLIVVKKR